MEPLKLDYTVDGENFISAGEASSNIKTVLKKLGFPADVIRRVAISMYEAEINMVIHAHGGKAHVEIGDDQIVITLSDHGPGIENIELAMKEGYSTAPDDVRSLGFGAGMGLPNIKKYSDDLQIESSVGIGTTVKITVCC